MSNGSWLVKYFKVYILKDCERLEDYRTANVMMIGTSCATIVVLVLITGTLIYQRCKKGRRIRQIEETPRPNREPSCYMETETINIIELDILNSNCLDTIVVGDDPITGGLMEDLDATVEVVRPRT